MTPRERSILDELWDEINAIGGTAKPDDEFGHGVNHAVDLALAAINRRRRENAARLEDAA